MKYKSLAVRKKNVIKSRFALPFDIFIYHFPLRFIIFHYTQFKSCIINNHILFDFYSSCQSDVLYSGNSRIASLHLKNLKEDCRQVIQTDKSLALTLQHKDEILKALCLSSCSGHGTCHDGAYNFFIISIDIFLGLTMLQDAQCCTGYRKSKRVKCTA